MGCAASSETSKMADANVRIETGGPGEDFKLQKGPIPACPAKGLVIKVRRFFFSFFFSDFYSCKYL